MNADQLQGKWKQLKGNAKQRWAKFTDDDWQAIAGKRDVFVGRIQERYGIAREEAQKQADEWTHRLNESDFEQAGASKHEHQTASKH
jgi:uncharacterized protein YjbJ (UPF0337 family)